MGSNTSGKGTDAESADAVAGGDLWECRSTVVPAMTMETIITISLAAKPH